MLCEKNEHRGNKCSYFGIFCCLVSFMACFFEMFCETGLRKARQILKVVKAFFQENTP